MASGRLLKHRAMVKFQKLRCHFFKTDFEFNAWGFRFRKRIFLQRLFHPLTTDYGQGVFWTNCISMGDAGAAMFMLSGRVCPPPPLPASSRCAHRPHLAAVATGKTRSRPVSRSVRPPAPYDAWEPAVGCTQCRGVRVGWGR